MFKTILEPTKSLELDLMIDLKPLTLNRSTDFPTIEKRIEPAKNLTVIDSKNSSDCTNVSGGNVSEVGKGNSNNRAKSIDEDTDAIIGSPVLPIATEMPTSEVVENPQLPAAHRSVEKLMQEGIQYLADHKKVIAYPPIDVDDIKMGIRTIFKHSNYPSNFADTIITSNSIVIKLHGDVTLNPGKLTKLRDTFLSVVGLSLRKVYPDRGVIVLVFNREKREMVYHGDLLALSVPTRIKTIQQGYNDKILIGQNEFGEDCCFFSLDGASPHVLVGGQTKSGKSILMNNMILDLIMTNTPDNIKLRLFDPKQVEFAAYSESAHLAHPVVLNKITAIQRLIELEEMMNRRYEIFKDLGVKNFEIYNEKHPYERMSRDIVFFDELADWILDTEFKKEAKPVMEKLVQKGRAAGVNLVLATQRPSNDVVTPILRANLDTKIALKVDRDLNSEIILGETGAEELLGYGHGIVKTEGKTTYVQVGFTETDVFDELVRITIDYWKPVI